jgi:hypothetical protein
MNWDQIYDSMAFYPYKGDLASAMKVKDAMTTLYCFLQGQAKPYEVIDALGYLEQRFGAGVMMGAQAIRKALPMEESSAREQLCYEAISKIEKYILRNHSARIE